MMKVDLSGLPEPERLAASLREASRFAHRPCVTGISIGEPSENGRVLEGQLAVCIHVREKFPERLLRKNQVLPRQVGGLRLDVEQRNHRPRELSDDELLRRQILPADPAQPGVEVGVEKVRPGSLGMIVYDRTDGSPCLLSAAHVLSGGPRATVYQPGWFNEAQPIGTIRRSVWDQEGDAAIAVLDRYRSFDATPLQGIRPTGIRRAQVGDLLEKSGAMTGVTRAKVKGVGSWDVPYAGRGTIPMQGFELRPVDPLDRSEISDGGDSGSLWYDPASGEAVGLTVAGDGGPVDGDEWTLCCHLDLVFHRLQISLDPEDRL